ncbi:MAG: metallophosphoesterase family protein [Bacteroidota bacterium]
MGDKNTVYRMGVISDNHGQLRPESVELLEGVDEIWHAGDYGKVELLEALRAIAPLTYVSGNVDGWKPPLTATKTVCGHKIHLLHRISDLALDPVAEEIDLVIYGHSHKPAREVHHGVTYLNPGAAGRRRFHLPLTQAIIHISPTGFEIQFWELPEKTQFILGA